MQDLGEKEMKVLDFSMTMAIGFTSIAPMSIAAEGSRPSVTHSQLLVSYFADLSDIAANGATIEFFGWSESFRKARGACQIVSSDEVVHEFTNIVKEVVDGVESVNAHAINAFAEVVGSGSYNYCTDIVCRQMSCDQFYYFISTSSNYKIRFQIAHED